MYISCVNVKMREIRDMGWQPGRQAQHMGWQLPPSTTLQSFFFLLPSLCHFSLFFLFSVCSFLSIKSFFSCLLSLFPIPHFLQLLFPSASSSSLAARWCYLCPNHVKSIHTLKLPVGCCDAPLACCIVSRLRLLTVRRLIKLHCVLRTETGAQRK